MTVANDGSPTFFNGRQATAIDVTAVSRSFIRNVTWYVNPDLYGSDHYPVQIQLCTASAPQTTRRPRWRYQEADWVSYEDEICLLMEQRNPEDIEDFSKMIYDAATATIPRTSSNPGRRALRWWNEDIKRTIKARRKALRRVKRLPVGHVDKEAAQNEYRKLNIQCRQQVRNAKRDCWPNFLESISANQSSTELWGRVNALSGKRRHTPLQIVVDGAGILTQNRLQKS